MSTVQSAARGPRQPRCDSQTRPRDMLSRRVRGTRVAAARPRVFERLAEDYRARPPYPEALVARLSDARRRGAPGGGPRRRDGSARRAAGPARAPGARRRARPGDARGLRRGVCRARCHPGAGPRRVDGARERPRRVWSSSPTPSTGSAPTPAVPRRAGCSRPTGWRRWSSPSRWTRPSCGECRRCSPPPTRRRGACRRGPRARQFLVLAAGPGRPRGGVGATRPARGAEALRRVVRSLSYGGRRSGPAATERLLDAVDALGEREGREWARVLRLLWLRRGRRSRPTRTRPPRR